MAMSDFTNPSDYVANTNNTGTINPNTKFN